MITDYNNLKEVKCIRKTEDIRPFIEGILFILKGGCQWRLLPEVYDKWQRVYKRFIRSKKKEIWMKLFKSTAYWTDLQEVMIDSTMVRVH
ncbi:MAG: hypothetical protein P857_1073 [Candidatus Xenolissoclinum pacificiensis L6]|uniref:Insertion element IS402-like domain-containing protein n=1 Tax=Candidatus Xenolissoclinum pacificiensis L6 TaxID=1401685 RepID=W2V356_9RICK|nr:MAG: hypothetical protein P857_1073 [Candidatus Xenolissoclinum pacificiensis L6]